MMDRGSVQTLLAESLLVRYRIGLPFWVLLSIIIAPALVSVLVIFLTSSKFSLLDPHVQVPHHANQVLLITLVATVGVFLGWLLSSINGTRNGSSKVVPRFLESILVPCRHRYFSYMAVAIVSGTFAMQSLPGNVWTSAYVRGMEPYLGIGIFPVFAVFAVLGLISLQLSGVRFHKYQLMAVILVAAYVIFACLLFRGARLDSAGFFLAGGLLLWVRVNSIKARLFIVLLAISTILGMHVWGVYRAVAVHCDMTLVEVATQAISAPWTAGCKEMVSLPAAIAVGREGTALVGQDSDHLHPQQNKLAISISTVGNVPQQNKLAVSISTVGNVAVSLYQLLDALETGAIEYQFGQTYLNYLPRTLPSIVYPDRPGDFSIPNVSLGLGSLYFLTEAYANFGIAGVALISLFVGWLYGLVLGWGSQQRSFAATLIFLLIFTLLLRVTWYQFFGLYKALLTWFMLEAGIYWLTKRLASGSQSSKGWR
jgi:hypothetical protein